jgi:hypothetical protein
MQSDQAAFPALWSRGGSFLYRKIFFWPIVDLMFLFGMIRTDLAFVDENQSCSAHHFF